MPLPPPDPRQEFHQRRVDCRGFRRDDGRWDIEGRIVDTKSYAFDNRFRGRIEPGTPLHDMSVRLTIDEDMVVHDAVAVTDASPFRICPEAADAIRSVIGLRIGPGWNRKIKERLGRTHGCTHIMELLGPMATTAFQTLTMVRKSKPLEPGKVPGLLDQCYAYASDREVVKERWPAFYTGPK